MQIIAHLFRDIGQPDTGLTAGVEEIAGAIMRRKAKADRGDEPRQQPRRFVQDTKAKAKPKGRKITETQRLILDYLRLRARVRTSQMAHDLGIGKKETWEACERLRNRRGIVSTPAVQCYEVKWTITQQGLDALESGVWLYGVGLNPQQVAAE